MENARRRANGGKNLKNKASPCQAFCRRHLGNPEYPVLVRSILGGDSKVATAIMCRNTTDGWRKILAEKGFSDTRASFLYLVRLGGRKPRKATFSRAEPLRDNEGKLRFRAQEKCNLLSDHSEEKLGGKSRKEERMGGANTGKAATGRTYGKLVNGPLDPVREVGVCKAFSGLA